MAEHLSAIPTHTSLLQKEGVSLSARLKTESLHLQVLLYKNEDDLKAQMPSGRLVLDVSTGLASVSKCGIQAKTVVVTPVAKEI